MLNQLRRDENFLPIRKTKAIILTIALCGQASFAPPPNERGGEPNATSVSPSPCWPISTTKCIASMGLRRSDGQPLEAVFVVDRAA